MSASVNRFATCMVVQTYPIQNTIAILCRSSDLAFALSLTFPQVLSVLLPTLCTQIQKFHLNLTPIRKPCMNYGRLQGEHFYAIILNSGAKLIRYSQI